MGVARGGRGGMCVCYLHLKVSTDGWKIMSFMNRLANWLHRPKSQKL